jgi:hypothetical protein
MRNKIAFVSRHLFRTVVICESVDTENDSNADNKGLPKASEVMINLLNQDPPKVRLQEIYLLEGNILKSTPSLSDSLGGLPAFKAQYPSLCSSIRNLPPLKKAVAKESPPANRPNEIFPFLYLGNEIHSRNKGIQVL